MRRHRAIDDTVERARHFGAVARDALAPFPDSPGVGAARGRGLLHQPGLLAGMVPVLTRNRPENGRDGVGRSSRNGEAGGDRDEHNVLGGWCGSEFGTHVANVTDE